MKLSRQPDRKILSLFDLPLRSTELSEPIFPELESAVMFLVLPTLDIVPAEI